MRAVGTSWSLRLFHEVISQFENTALEVEMVFGHPIVLFATSDCQIGGSDGCKARSDRGLKLLEEGSFLAPTWAE